MRPFFSVLVPVYNVEPYLSQCLESLINQTFTQLQIICINDGSTDDSLKILQKYSQIDNRIQIVNQKNQGYGASLNNLFPYVKGSYVSIIEPDDYLSLNAYETYYHVIQQYPDADIVKFAFWEFFDSEKIQMPSSSSELTLTDKPFSITQYPQLLLYHPSVWSCVYRHNFLKENKLLFVEAPGAGWTDNPFFISTMCLAKKIIWRNHKVYHYRKGHTTASSNLKDCKIPIERLMDILNVIEQEEINDFGILLCIYKRIFSYINIVRDNIHYNKEQIEPLIGKVLARLDVSIVETEFFCTQEKRILTDFKEQRFEK